MWKPLRVDLIQKIKPIFPRQTGFTIDGAVFPAKSLAIIRSDGVRGYISIVVAAKLQQAPGVCRGGVDVKGNVELLALWLVVVTLSIIFLVYALHDELRLVKNLKCVVGRKQRPQNK